MGNKSNITLGDVEPCIDYIKVYDSIPGTNDVDRIFNHESEDSNIEIEMNINSLAQCIAFIGANGDSTLRAFWKKGFKDNIEILDTDIFVIARTALEGCLETFEKGTASYYQMKATIELLKELDDKYCY